MALASCSTHAWSARPCVFTGRTARLPGAARPRSWHTAHAAPGDTRQPDSGLLREEELMQRDLERYQQRASVTPQTFQTLEEAAPSGALDTAKNFLDKLLIADFFAVLAILLWLGAGVAAKVLLDAWFPLWPRVFQPAIGVLMLGALVSGAVGWVQGQSSSR